MGIRKAFLSIRVYKKYAVKTFHFKDRFTFRNQVSRIVGKALWIEKSKVGGI